MEDFWDNEQQGRGNITSWVLVVIMMWVVWGVCQWGWCIVILLGLLDGLSLVATGGYVCIHRLWQTIFLFKSCQEWTLMEDDFHTVIWEFEETIKYHEQSGWIKSWQSLDDANRKRGMIWKVHCGGQATERNNSRNICSLLLLDDWNDWNKGKGNNRNLDSKTDKRNVSQECKTFSYIIWNEWCECES